MTTSTTPTTQYNNSFGGNSIQSSSYSNYLCGVYNQRILFATASTNTTSTTFAPLATKTVPSNANGMLLSQKAPMLQALPTLRSDLSLNDTGLFAVYHFIKNFIG